MTATIDLNADLGEGFPNDAPLLDLVTSTSVSCGAHAGNPETILATLDAARSRGVAVGAHPGYDDPDHFGRRDLALPADDVRRLVLLQFEALDRLAFSTGVSLRFVKPHGSLYNQAQREEEVARGVVAALREINLPLLGQPASLAERLAGESGVTFVPEGFPDRRYEPDGRLVPRSRPDAVLHDPREFEDQVVRLAWGGFRTLCIHGDDPRAVDNARRLVGVLGRNGLAPKFWG